MADQPAPIRPGGWAPSSPGGATDPNAFPGSGSGSSTAQDSMFGLSKALGAIPVKIRNDAATDQERKVDYQDNIPTVVNWQAARQQIYLIPPEQRANLQQKLYDAGFYPKSYYGKTPDIIVPGELDQGTITAWFDAIEEAVRSSTYDAAGHITNPKSIQDVIDERTAANNKAGGPGGTLGVRLTNPTDLRMVAKDTGQKFLGRNPDPHFVDNYVAAYHAAEVAAQNPDASGNVTAAPDPQAFAEQMMRQQYPVDVGVNDALNVGNQLVNALSRPAGSTLPTSGQVNG